ncbi:hypothetical protein J3458_006952 [Metarhizium acridum]|uniref:uncharacterized protein n=1 Tax=Metarhizium acridum TaxID=92637 RepID=UPI001C6BD8DA|nr:hypothetical protein J3458_006952 [Metarhizium acridum]
MWLALDYWKRAGLYRPGSEKNSSIKVSFATGLPVMFGVPKYSATLDQLRRERGVEGLFQRDLVSIDGNQATFVLPDGKQVTRRFDFLHVVPKLGPHAFVANSPLADATGFVDVNSSTMRHRTFGNVWSIGDASNLPTSKTAAATTAQAPILVSNLLCALEGAKMNAVYDFVPPHNRVRQSSPRRVQVWRRAKRNLWKADQSGCSRPRILLSQEKFLSLGVQEVYGQGSLGRSEGLHQTKIGLGRFCEQY